MSFTTPTASISDATGIADPDALPTSNQDPAAITAAVASPDNDLTRPPAPVAPTVPVTVSNLTAKAPNTTFAKYAAALYPALITLGTAAAVLPKHHTQLDLVQFAIVVAGVLGAVFAVVLPQVGWWPGILKTGILIVAAILTLVPPLLTAHGDFAHVDATSWILFGVAAVNAAAHELGIQQRTTANAKTEENLLK